MASSSVAAACRLLPWLIAGLVLLPPIEVPPLSADDSPTAVGTWVTGARAPSERSEVAVGSLDGKVFVIGGLEAPRAGDLMTVAVSRTVEEYDPVRNAWTPRAALPAALHHAAAAVIESHLYVVGGFTRSGMSLWTPVATLYRYSPATDTWTERRPMPTARGALAVAVVENKLFVIGGYDGTRNTGAVEVYDPTTDAWTTGASLPTPRDHLAAATVGQEIYAIGGRRNRDYSLNLAVVERYEPAANRWERKMDLPTPRSGLTAATLGDRLYVFGGERPEGTFRATEAYVPRTDRWHAVADMPTARHGLGAGVVENRIYVMSGGPTPGGSFSNLTEIYVPPKGTHAAPSSPSRASAAHVGAVMAVLAVWSEAGVLPPESTPDANRIVKALIQFQSAMMKSTNPHVVRFLDGAFQRKFGESADRERRRSRQQGWTSRTLEAVVEYGTESMPGDQVGLEAGWREYNIGPQDLRLLAEVHAAATKRYAAEGKDIHTVYENTRRLMPGAR